MPNAYGCDTANGYTLDNGTGYEAADGATANYISCVKTDKDGNVVDEKAPTCQNGYSLSGGSDIQSDSYTGSCVDSAGNAAAALVPDGILAAGVGDCSAANIQASAGMGDDGVVLSNQEASTLSCISTYESGCVNGVAAAATGAGPSSASGVFQILVGYGGNNATQSHDLMFNSCQAAANAAGYSDAQLNAAAGAFNGGQGVSPDGGLVCSNASRSLMIQTLSTCTRQGCSSSGNALVDGCIAASRNSTCNIQSAAGLIADKNPNASACTLFSDWTADSRANRQAQCINQNYGTQCSVSR